MMQDKNGRKEELRMKFRACVCKFNRLHQTCLPSMMPDSNLPAMHNPTFPTTRQQPKRERMKSKAGRKKCSSGERTPMCNCDEQQKGLKIKSINPAAPTHTDRALQFFSYVHFSPDIRKVLLVAFPSEGGFVPKRAQTARRRQNYTLKATPK